MDNDKYIVKRRVGDYVRYIYVDPPKMCGRCGEEVFEMEDEKD